DNGCPPGTCKYKPDAPNECPARRMQHWQLCEEFQHFPRDVRATMERLEKILKTPAPASAAQRKLRQDVDEPPPDPTVTLKSDHLNSWTGSGQIALETLRAMEASEGQAIRLEHNHFDAMYYDLPHWAKSRLDAGSPGGWVLQLGVPTQRVDTKRRAVAFTMW